MIEKSLIIIIFMYAASFSIISGQYIIGDVFGITITNFEGVPIESNLLAIVDQDAINQMSSNVTNINQTLVETDPILAAANATYELFLLLTGTYVFNFLVLMGLPVIFVAGMVLLYLILLARTLIGYLRGV